MIEWKFTSLCIDLSFDISISVYIFTLETSCQLIRHPKETWCYSLALCWPILLTFKVISDCCTIGIERKSCSRSYVSVLASGHILHKADKSYISVEVLIVPGLLEVQQVELGQLDLFRRCWRLFTSHPSDLFSCTSGWRDADIELPGGWVWFNADTTHHFTN